ncbi:hypothetical protein NMY22_g7227 [Coprinellus aureogranulatus]|nr:hypothetical protein NMY22_g7227 [Coprinellus aureogranulatus]
MSSPPTSPSRRVHFQEQDIIINKRNSDSSDSDGRNVTPSPTHSNSTLESPELASPVSLPSFTFPFAPGSPCGSDQGLPVLDPSLRVPPMHQLPLFSYDMMRNPRGRYAIVPSLPESTLLRSAVTPPQAKMTILVKSGLQWDIEVRPALPAADSSGAQRERPRYVTVGDVLCALYDDLQKRLEPEDLVQLSPDWQTKVEVQFRRRRERMKMKKERWDDATERRRRIDLLEASHRFVGLEYRQVDNKWVLRFEEHP